MTQLIRVAHSPDSDDAFMFYALATGKIDTGDYQVEHILKDIETLNQAALLGIYEVSAVSFHAYAFIHDRYILLPHGASIGKGYGPLIVAKHALKPADLTSARIAVPGKLTTAYLAMKIYDAKLEGDVVPFDEIIPSVLAGKHDAGLIIHEGQLTYAQDGLQKVLDLGAWWQGKHSMPLPLGGNVIRRDLGDRTIRNVALLISQSIRYGLKHRSEALDYAAQFARGLDPELMDRFVGMYVNDFTVDYSTDGRKAVQVLLDEAQKKGILKERVVAEYVG
ncbi:MAG TPA: MqnA/MqnD/SBP family protein [Acidobacteriota bacterium]|jgi:1,4-dihydroxy-6-naphthoate synthase|nr:MqnA/MqnD/SBP family protein [Acidobacteriota bacterium]